MSSRALLMLLTVLLAACGETTETAAPAAEVAAEAAAADGPSAAVMAQWARSCALCHAGGEGGAPRVGDPEAWAARLAQGEETLLAHTIEGYNNMPPLGYCMDCEAEDFRQLIRFMAGAP